MNKNLKKIAIIALYALSIIVALGVTMVQLENGRRNRRSRRWRDQ